MRNKKKLTYFINTGSEKLIANILPLGKTFETCSSKLEG